MPTMSTRFHCGLALALAVCTAATAQTPPPRQDTVRFFTYENDSRFNTDRFYTSGVQFSIKRAVDRRGRFARAMTDWMCGPLGCSDATLLTSQTNIGQLIFTPQDITRSYAQPCDRPWAGLLYYEEVYAFLSRDQRTLTTLTGQAGFTGRWSLAEPAQKIFHKLLDRPEPRGWDHQVGSRLGVLASAERRRAVPALSTPLWRDVELNTATYWRVAAGNIQTYAAAGLAVVVGKDLPPVSPPPPGIANKLRSSGAGKGISTACFVPSVQCTAFGSIEGRLMAYNVFFDSRPFLDHADVRRRTFVRDLVVGTRLDFPNTRTASHGPWFVQLKLTRRSAEFKSPLPVPKHRTAAITVGTEF